MADELKISLKMDFAKSNRQVSTSDMGAIGLEFDVSGTEYVRLTQSIGTSAEAIDLGQDIGTAGYMFVKNRDATNYVTIRMGSSGADVIKLKAGEVALFRLAASTPYAIADTAACVIEYIIVED